MNANSPQYRAIVRRASLATGKDGGPGLVEYIDRLERGFLYLDAKLEHRAYRPRQRHQIHARMRYHDDR